MSSSTLINGKHYKQVVIEYYDDLIAQLDVHAEEQLEKFKNDDDFNKYESKKANKPTKEFYYKKEKFFKEISKIFDIYSRTKYSEFAISNETSELTFQDFVHVERMRGINVLKKLQKDRLEELKLAKVKPTTTGEALFGDKEFAFLLPIEESKYIEMSMKFRLLVVVVDFYLEKVQIEQIK
jgi:hypothetical protein